MSVVIVMAGSGGAGKTSASKEFALGEPEEIVSYETITLQSGAEDVRKCVYTLYENCGLTGNHNSGTDTNNSPELVRIALNNCLANRDVAIIDGYMSTPRWVEAINEHADEVTDVIIVLFDLTRDELLRRIAKRLGVEVDQLPEKRIHRADVSSSRPRVLIQRFDELSKVPYTIIKVHDHHTPHMIASMLDAKLCDIFQDCEE